MKPAVKVGIFGKFTKLIYGKQNNFCSMMLPVMQYTVLLSFLLYDVEAMFTYSDVDGSPLCPVVCAGVE